MFHRTQHWSLSPLAYYDILKGDTSFGKSHYLKWDEALTAEDKVGWNLLWNCLISAREIVHSPNAYTCKCMFYFSPKHLICLNLFLKWLRCLQSSNCPQWWQWWLLWYESFPIVADFRRYSWSDQHSRRVTDRNTHMDCGDIKEVNSNKSCAQQGGWREPGSSHYSDSLLGWGTM